MEYSDLREYIDLVGRLGEAKTIENADPEEVLWAMGTRREVEKIDIIRDIWTAMTPPLIKRQ